MKQLFGASLMLLAVLAFSMAMLSAIALAVTPGIAAWMLIASTIAGFFGSTLCD